MKYLISLSLFLAATQAFSEATPTGNHLLRFVCQEYSIEDPLNNVLLLEQLSVIPLDKKSVAGGFDTVDGSVLIDPDDYVRFYTGEVDFRMRIFKTSLISDQRSADQIIEDLIQREADLDVEGQLMDYTGYGVRVLSEFRFISTGSSEFVKDVSISLLDESISLKKFEGGMDTKNGSLEDGIYRCKDPVLIPEMTN